MKKYIIERKVPGIGNKKDDDYTELCRQSQGVLDGLGNGIQWQESYVIGDGTFCVYLAENEDLIRKHAEKSGFPADRIMEVKRTIDPTTAAPKS